MALKFGSKSSNFMQGYPEHETSALKHEGHLPKGETHFHGGEPGEETAGNVVRSEEEGKGKRFNVVTGEEESTPGVTPKEAGEQHKERKGEVEGEEKKEKKKIDWKNVFKNIGQVLNRAGERYNERDPGKAEWLPNKAVDNELEATPDSQNKQTEHEAPEANTTKTEDPMTAETSQAGIVFKTVHDKVLKSKHGKERADYYNKHNLAHDDTIDDKYKCPGAGCPGTE